MMVLLFNDGMEGEPPIHSLDHSDWSLTLVEGSLRWTAVLHRLQQQTAPVLLTRF